MRRMSVLPDEGPGRWATGPLPLTPGLTSRRQTQHDAQRSQREDVPVEARCELEDHAVLEEADVLADRNEDPPHVAGGVSDHRGRIDGRLEDRPSVTVIDE